MLARDTLGGARSLQQELVRADVAPPQRLKARLIVCGIQGIAEAMPSHESRVFSSLLDYSLSKLSHYP